jgi:hypothetical protein
MVSRVDEDTTGTLIGLGIYAVLILGTRVDRAARRGGSDPAEAGR